jgi:hypothetical protein
MQHPVPKNRPFQGIHRFNRNNIDS